MSVPENRSNPNSNTVQISLAILRHPDNNPEPDPIIFLQGGPGGRTLDNLYLTFEHRFKPLFAANRDIILFDQRGIGSSRPSLDCMTHRITETNLLDYENEGQYLSRPEIENLLIDSLIQCAQALASIHDLSGYNSIESAADIEAMRIALGYEQVNLWGISYGSKLALTAMRDFPESFRRIVLDSVYPLEANLYTELASNFDRALSVLFENCAADSACNQRFPDLESVLFNTVDALNQRAIRFNAPNPYNNQSFEGIIFDGDALLYALFRLLYSSDLLPRLPELIYQASEGNFDIWLVLVGWLTAQHDNITVGMNYAVQCQEEFFFTEAGSIQAAWANYPHFASYSQSMKSLKQLQLICEAFQAGESPLSENQPVNSAIPALIITGEYDPITPPQWAMQVDEQLSNSLYFEFPSQGHGASGTIGCAQSMVIDFFTLEDFTTLDSGCIDDIHMVFSGTQTGDFNLPNSANSGFFGILDAR